jgi:membrane protein DedA with SNARE-associated domain
MIVYNIAIFAGVFGLGMVAGYLLGRFGKPVEATLVVDREVLHQLSLAMVNAWLDQHGMTWQPKGAVYEPGSTVKK